MDVAIPEDKTAKQNEAENKQKYKFTNLIKE